MYSWDEFIDDSANFSAGFGDTLTSGFGIFDSSLTGMTRDAFDIGSVNMCSGAYSGGKYGAYAWAAITITAVAARSAGAKIVGSAQSTGTFGHAAVSRATAYFYALNPNVVRVTLDLGYKRLLAGSRNMVGRWGPRPDVGVLYRNGNIKITEVASKTDKVAKLIERNLRKMRQEGLSGPAPSVNNWAVRLNRWFGG